METEQKPKLRLEISIDDGDVLDLQMAALLTSYKLPAVFYIPSNTALDPLEINHMANKMGFEIGGHTVNHPQDMKLLTSEAITYEVVDNKQWLESVISKEITKFCYPRGRYNDLVVDQVKKAGYTEARTTEILQTVCSDPLRKPTTIHVYQRSEYLGEPWEKVARKYADWASYTDGVFHIWMHSWEVNRDENWGKLELFFKWARENYELITEQ